MINKRKMDVAIADEVIHLQARSSLISITKGETHGKGNFFVFGGFGFPAVSMMVIYLLSPLIRSVW